jgi:Helix-turn-helix domain
MRGGSVSLEMTKRVWDDESLKNASDKLVMLALADSYNPNGPRGGLFPSVDFIVKKTGMERRSVFRVVNRLEARKYLSREAGLVVGAQISTNCALQW